ncbi:LamG domain-containing protein [Methanospirillum hungatei]|uniref:LamG domain-containing protein n=1 Tax=Methanospirillum hungatei TaxID=2203 RepID=UPI0026F36ADB|nr:LamG domain-containing protein [Methanospirillum hungatei]MCA1917179.1 LamG domain-containing protein [Methanospirillum hungatei]
MTQLRNLQNNIRPVKSESAVSALIGVILLLFLLVLLTGIISAVLFGFLSGMSFKSAYIVVDAQYSTQNGYPSITLMHLQGDPGYFADIKTDGPGYPLTIRIETVDGSSVAVPRPPGQIWRPGTLLFITHSDTGYVVTADKAQIPGTRLPFPGDDIRLSVIDSRNQVLVYSKTFIINGTLVNTSQNNTTQKFVRGAGYSVSAWIRFTSPPTPTSPDQNWATVVVDGDRDSNRRYHLQHNSDNSRFEFAFRTAQMAAGGRAASYIQSPDGPVQNRWFHLAGVYNQTSGRIRLYVNGAEVASRILDSSGIADSPGLYQTGGPDGINFHSAIHQRKLRGEIRGISTLDEEMFPEEIRSVYAAG